MVEKARRMNGWTIIRVEMNIRFRGRGSPWRWFWLAMIISGRSQQDSTRRGEEIWLIPVQLDRNL